MPHSKPIDTVHDLFASVSSTPEDSSDSVDETRFQGDVYEQLADLDYIYVDREALDAAIVSDADTSNDGTPISLIDFFEGLAQLATMGVVEVTDIVEAVHREVILRPLGRFNDNHVNKWQRGITGRIYGTVRKTMQLVGNNLASGLQLYNNLLNPKTVQPLPKSLRRLINILNGVMGDHLVTYDNPLAVSMLLYNQRCQVQHKALSGRVIILCHGLCMSHLSWHVSKKNRLGKAIMRSLPNATVLYLNYNTGRRISINGRNFSKVLQDLVDSNPDISQIDLIGHSMGGLVARSALFYAKQQGFDWVKMVGNLVTLGSPHNGANLERIGYFVQDRIAKLPFAGSLAKLGDLRSAGIIDLRYGSIRDADWQALEGRSVLPAEFRHPTRLPFHVHSYLVAATLVEGHYDSKATSLLGDGLVTVESALGEYAGAQALMVPDSHKAIFYGVSHYDLLYNDRVHQQVVEWLVDNGAHEHSQSGYAIGSCIHSYPNNVKVVV